MSAVVTGYSAEINERATALGEMTLEIVDGDADEGAESWMTTLAEFLNDNEDGLPEEDALAIMALGPSESHRIGGGAAPTYTVRRPL